ncbi:hypothetical protein OIU78_013464 [Salix suchowensis]|nr:hypothetical protein OIU78_013464 [Salix suchowensis]
MKLVNGEALSNIQDLPILTLTFAMFRGGATEFPGGATEFPGGAYAFASLSSSWRWFSDFQTTPLAYFKSFSSVAVKEPARDLEQRQVVRYLCIKSYTSR